MIDTHCHFNFSDFNENRDEILKSAFENKVYKIINPSSSIKDSNESFEMAQKYENVFFSPGIHPESILDLENVKKIEQYINDKKCVGIGEIGLDYHYPDFDKNKQKDLFIAQLEIAKKYNKPVIIHNRDSKEDLYDILKTYDLKGVLHCYSEDKNFAKKVLDLGFYISFTCNITFKNVKDYIVEAVKYIPNDRILCETDAPFLAPQEFRGQLNKPEYVKYVYNKICEIKGLEFGDFEKQVDKNVKNLFGI